MSAYSEKLKIADIGFDDVPVTDVFGFAFFISPWQGLASLVIEVDNRGIAEAGASESLECKLSRPNAEFQRPQARLMTSNK